MNDSLKFGTELKLWKYKIERIARRFGLAFDPIIYNIVTSQEMSEVVARHGFPAAPHHWRYGQQSLSLKRQFRHGLGRIYEIVLNTVPSYAFLLQVNDVITQKAVMAHVPGHGDMNKNNPYFVPTNRNMLNAMASDALMIERLHALIGRDTVEAFFDKVLSFESFIDQNQMYQPRWPVQEEEDRDAEVKGHRGRVEPTHIRPREELPEYMDEFLNPPEWLEKESERLTEELRKRVDIKRGVRTPAKPEKDILGFLARHAPLETWQRDIVAMIWRHSIYFAPMRRTKLMHEGWATFFEEEIMTEAGMIGHNELSQFVIELAGVQRKGSGLNPYRLGYELWKDIRMRWNTGRHGAIWERCERHSIKDNWDYFIVFKSLADEYGFDSPEFSSRWALFSAFVAELKKGNLGFPAEFFTRNLLTQEYLIYAWLRFLHAEDEYQKFIRMQREMEPLELDAALLSKQLIEESPEMVHEELELKARSRIFKSAGREDLWVWTPGEVKRELAGLLKLTLFRKKWEHDKTGSGAIPTDSEWVDWAKKYPDKVVLGKGNTKIFEVRATCDDLMFLDEFFTKDFCEEHHYFLYKSRTVWDFSDGGSAKRYVIESRAFERVKKRLLFQYTNFFLPYIYVVDADYKGRGELYLRHEHSGVDLDRWSKNGMYIKDVLMHLFEIWGGRKAVHLETIKTKKAEDKPWWFHWHQTREEKTKDSEMQSGRRARFSIVWDQKERKPVFKELELEEVEFKAPF